MVASGLSLVLACLSGLVGGFTRDEWIRKANFLDSLFKAKNIVDNEKEVIKIYTDDAVVMPSGFPALHGIEEYEKSLHKNRTDENHYSWSSKEKPLYFTDDMAIMKIDFEYKLSPESETNTAKGLAFLRKVDGQASIRLSIWNYDS